MARALDDDLQVALGGVLDGADDVLDRGRKHDDGRAQVGCQVPREAGVVPAAVIGKDVLVMFVGAHGGLLVTGC